MSIGTNGTLKPGARLVSLGGHGELELDAGSLVTLPSVVELAAHGAARVLLSHGRARARVTPHASDSPFMIVTPHVQVIVVGPLFSVSVEPAVTIVSVEQGRVRVEKAGRALLLDAGQTLRSNDTRLDRNEPAASLQPASTCPSSAEPAARRTCLARAAELKGLAAQNALVALGLLERDELGDRAAALSRFREYERRYPRGVLAPEVALALVQTLMLEGQSAAARAAAADYARRFPEDTMTLRRLRALAPSGP